MAGQIDAEDIFRSGDRVAELGLISLTGARELTEKIDAHLVKWAEGSPLYKESYIVESECPRFSSGDGKGLIKSTIRGTTFSSSWTSATTAAAITSSDTRTPCPPTTTFRT